MDQHSPDQVTGGYIGSTIQIIGEVSGNEHLTIEGRVDGKIVVRGHHLSIGANARITGEIHAKTVMVVGEIVGNVTADDKVEVAPTGSIHGDIIAPRVVLADGARFKGSIDMQRQVSSKAQIAEPILAEPKRMLVEIHLPTANPAAEHARIERLQRAAEELLDSFGYTPDPEAVELALASWHWRQWFRRARPTLEREGREVYDGIKEALRRQQIDTVGADAFNKRATAAADLLRSLEVYPSAVVRLGDVIIVKAMIDGQSRIAIQTLSPETARELERNPLIGRDPVAFFALLEARNRNTKSSAAKEAGQDPQQEDERPSRL